MKPKYQTALENIPAPGTGCHPSLLGVANLGIMAGVTPEQLHNDIRQSVPHGRRRVSDREISDAIKKAASEHTDRDYTPKPRPKPIVKDGKAALQKIISQGKIETEVDLWEASPIRLLEDPIQDTILFLETLYSPDDLLFIGERDDAGILGDTIRTVADWIKHFRNNGKTSPFYIVNPLNGKLGLTKGENKESYRCDACVENFLYCLVEFDDLSYEEQIRFWSAVKLPVICLIHSGGKSIHALLEVKKLANVKTQEQWQSEIKTRLYDRILKPLGVDGACSNPARLSRLPGHYRAEKNSMQKILWLSHKGQSL